MTPADCEVTGKDCTQAKVIEQIAVGQTQILQALKGDPDDRTDGGIEGDLRDTRKVLADLKEEYHARGVRLVALEKTIDGPPHPGLAAQVIALTAQNAALVVRVEAAEKKATSFLGITSFADLKAIHGLAATLVFLLVMVANLLSRSESGAVSKTDIDNLRKQIMQELIQTHPTDTPVPGGAKP